MIKECMGDHSPIGKSPSLKRAKEEYDVYNTQHVLQKKYLKRSASKVIEK